MKNLMKQLWPLLLVISFALILYLAGVGDYLSFEYIQSQKNTLLAHVKTHFFLSAFLFFLVYTIIVAFSLPFATVLTLLGGFLFGVHAGSMLVIFAATLGATIIFLIAKSSFGAFLKSRAGKYYDRTKTEFETNGLQYLLFLRLAPIFPFAIVNILPAFFNMDVRKYIIATFFGIMPGSIVYVYAGQSLSEIDKISDLASRGIITAFILLSLLALMPVLLKKWKNRHARKS